MNKFLESEDLASLCPVQPWYMHPLLVVIFSGILPFGAVSVELFFIMSALWLHQFYYIFGTYTHTHLLDLNRRTQGDTFWTAL